LGFFSGVNDAELICLADPVPKAIQRVPTNC